MKTPTIKLYEVKIRDYSKKDVERYEIYATTIRKAWKAFKNLKPNIAVGFEFENIYPANDKCKESMLLIKYSYSKKQKSSIWITELKVCKAKWEEKKEIIPHAKII